MTRSERALKNINGVKSVYHAYLLLTVLHQLNERRLFAVVFLE